MDGTRPCGGKERRRMIGYLLERQTCASVLRCMSNASARVVACGSFCVAVHSRVRRQSINQSRSYYSTPCTMYSSKPYIYYLHTRPYVPNMVLVKGTRVTGTRAWLHRLLRLVCGPLVCHWHVVRSARTTLSRSRDRTSEVLTVKGLDGAAARPAKRRV